MYSLAELSIRATWVVVAVVAVVAVVVVSFLFPGRGRARGGWELSHF